MYRLAVAMTFSGASQALAECLTYSDLVSDRIFITHESNAAAKPVTGMLLSPVAWP
jgi:hypothetical protein